MTRERMFGWLGSFTLQIFALGALGVSPYLSYRDLPEPQATSAMPDYVPVTPRPPVAQKRAPVNPSKLRKPSVFPRGSYTPSEIPIGILNETGFVGDDTIGVPFGIPDDFPGVPEDTRPVATGSQSGQEPIHVGGNVTAPRKRHHVNPIYPAVAAAARVQGTVVIEATIDENGNVVNARVLRSIPVLDGAALEAVGQWKYEPTLLNGRPVPILMSVSVQFELGR